MNLRDLSALLVTLAEVDDEMEVDGVDDVVAQNGRVYLKPERGARPRVAVAAALPANVVAFRRARRRTDD